MAAIVSGAGLGLFNSSLNVLGSSSGDPLVGRAGQSNRNYLNAATGNLVIQNQDEFLAGLGLGTALVRTYNSQGLLNDDNGDNWRLNVAALFNIPGTPNSGGSTVSKRFGDGNEVVYTYDGTKYVSTDGDGAHDTLSYSSGTWTWTDGSGRNTETYNSTGQLTASSDVDGNSLTYTYSSGLLTRIDTASTGGSASEYVAIGYSGTDITSIQSVTGSTETLVTYGYDGSHRLTTVTVDLTPADTGDSVTYVTTYTYDSTSRRVASITQGDGTSVDYGYTNYSGTYKLTSITDGEGRATSISYNTGSRITTVTDALGQTTTFEYDTDSRLVEVTNGAGGTTTYGYDSDDNVTDVTDGNGNTVEMEYDGNGNLELKRDALGNTVTYTYDAYNQLVTLTSYLVADIDGSGSSNDPEEPFTTRYAYDSEHHLRFAVSADGRVTEYRYNSNGTRSSVIVFNDELYDLSGLDPEDPISESTLNTWVGTQDLEKILRTDYTYDGRGLLSSTRSFETTNSSGVGSSTNDSITQFVYDQRGRLLQAIDARGESNTPDADDDEITYATTYTYDGLGRVQSAVQWIRTSSGEKTRGSVSEYDDAGNAVEVTFDNGLITTSAYDDSGRLISVEQSDGSSLGTTTYTYDPEGKLRYTTDPTGIKSYFVYDDADRVVGNIDASGALVETVYDAAGNVVQTIAYATALASGAFTDLNNVSNDVALGDTYMRPSTSGDDRTTLMLYDEADRLAFVIAATDSGTTTGYVTQYVYDGASRLVEVIRYANALTIPGTPTLANVTPTTSSTYDRHTRTFYNNDGQVSAMLDGDGYLTENEYDAAGQLIKQSAYNAQTNSTYWASGSFDDLKGSISAGASDLLTFHFYDGKGQCVATIDAEKYLTEYAYDLAGNQTQSIRYATQTTFSGTPVLGSVRPSVATNDQITISTYNGANQVATVTNRHTTTGGSPTNVDIVTSYTYSDATGLLERTDAALGTGEVRTTRARYSAQGHVLQELTAQGSVVLDGLSSPTQQDIDDVWDDYSLTHTYDNAGRRLSTTDPNGHKTLFYYDADGRLAYTVNALGEVSQTIYNAFGEAKETIHYTTAISVSSLNGGLAANDSTFTTRLASAANSGIDSHYVTNYTLRGAVKSAVDALSATTTEITYNAFGELDTRKDYFSGTTDDYALTGDNVYDRRGNLKETHEDKNHGGYTGIDRKTQYVYDAFGRVTQTTLDTSGINHITAYAYDKLGRLLSTTIDSSGLNIVRSSTWDAFGRVLTTVDAIGTGSDHTTTHAYNDATRTFTITTPEGVVLTTTTNRFGETLTITDGTGTTVATYTYDENGNVETETDPAGLTVYVYDRAGLKTSSTRKIDDSDTTGTTTTFTYDAANRLMVRTVDTGSGHLNLATAYAYDAQGRTLSVTNGYGSGDERAVEYVYDKNGRVTQMIVDPAGLEIITEYEYDRQGNTITVTQAAGETEERVTEYVFDHLNRRKQEIIDPGSSPHLAITTEYTYDKADNVVAKSEGSGARLTRYVYDNNNRLTYVVDAMGGVVKNDYDKEGRVTATTAYSKKISLTSPSSLGNTIAASDITGRLTTDSAADQVTQYAYDRDGRLRFTVVSKGSDRYLSENVYDAANRVTRSTRYATAMSSSVAINVTDLGTAASSLANSATDEKRYNIYDGAGRTILGVTVVKIASTVSGYVTENVYDKNGNVVKTIGYANAITMPGTVNEANVRAQIDESEEHDRVTRMVYDKADRLTYTIDSAKDVDVSSVNHVFGYVKETVYNDAGEITLTKAYYDAIDTYSLGSLPGIDDIDTALAARSGTTPSKDQETEYAHDGAGRITSTTDAEGYTEYYGYDELGNKTSFTNKNGSSAGDTAYTWTYDYDAAGRMTDEHTPAIAITRIDSSGTATTGSAEHIVTHMVYDALGQLTSRTEAYGAAEERVTSYTYDALGHQTKTTFPSVGVYGASADSTAHYVSRNESSSTPTSVTYYDPLGNAIAGRDVNGNYSYKIYDQAGRLQVEIDAERYLTEYTYDVFSNVLTTTRYAVALTDAILNTALGGSSYTFSTRESGASDTAILALSAANITSILAARISADSHVNDYNRTLTNVYDQRNQLVEVRQPSVYNYDATSGAYSAAPTTQKLYNAFGQLIVQTVLQDLSASINTFSYYNRRGEKIAEVGQLGYLTTYQYDAAGNLIGQTEYAQGVATRDVDGYDDPTTHTASTASSTSDIGFDRVTTYTYDELNRKTSETKEDVIYTDAVSFDLVKGDLTTEYHYDRIGNLIRSVAPDGGVTRSYYDVLGRTTHVAEATREADDVGVPAQLPPLSPSTFAMHGEGVGATWGVLGPYTNGWLADNVLTLNWTSLAALGSGDVRVKINYTAVKGAGGTGAAYEEQVFSGLDALYGVTMTWGPDTTSSSEYFGLDSIDSVEITKIIDGQEVTIFDVSGSGTSVDVCQSNILAWAQSPVAGGEATLSYYVTGSGASPTVVTSASGGAIQKLGTLYWLDLGSVANGNYTYELKYARRGEALPYATGTGTFTLVAGTSTVSGKIVGFVQEPALNMVSDDSTVTWVTGAYITSHWAGENTVVLSWSSLEQFGEGAVRVHLTYDAQKQSGTHSNPDITRDFDLTAAEAMTGATLVWGADVPTDSTEYAALTAVSGIEVWKVIDGQEVKVLSSATGADVYTPKRLVLRGSTSGLTGVTINGSTYTATSLGNGLYVMDVSSLPRGHYTATTNGTSPSASIVFDVQGSTASITAIDVQEHAEVIGVDLQSWDRDWNGSTNVVALTWPSLETWGAGAVAVRITYNRDTDGDVKIKTVSSLAAADTQTGTTLSWSTASGYEKLKSILRIEIFKSIGGQEVLVYDNFGNEGFGALTGDAYNRRLVVSGLPTTSRHLTFKYRVAGAGSWTTVTTAATALNSTSNAYTGWFGVDYSAVPNGSYQYQITVTDGSNAAVNLSSLGGDIYGVREGTFVVNRSGQGFSTTTGSARTPVTGYVHDIFGNVVRETRYASGVATISDTAVTVQANAGSDQIVTSYYDAFGRVIRKVDAVGTSFYTSYDAAGNARKTWHSVTNIDSTTVQSTTLNTYDRLNRQLTASNPFIATSGVTIDTHTQTWNSFGEISAKGVNSTGFETFEYDLAGRLWRTNQTDGVWRVYFYNRVGQETSHVESADVDLSSYASPSAVNALSSSVLRRTNTFYDALGRKVGQSQPSYTQGGVEAVNGAMQLTTFALDKAATTTTTWVTGAYITSHWSGTNSVTLKWTSLEQWGTGDVQVRLVVTMKKQNGSSQSQTKDFVLSAAESFNGATLSWDPTDIYDATEYASMYSVNTIEVSKVVGGRAVQIFDTSGTDTFTGTVLTWSAPDNSTDVSLSYRKRNATVPNPNSWTTINNLASGDIEQRGSVYWVDLEALGLYNDQYDYELYYTHADQETYYAHATGTFMVTTDNASGDNVAGFVTEPTVKVDASNDVTWVTPGPYVTGGWSGTNTVDLSWTSLESFGIGSDSVRIRMNYTATDGHGDVDAIANDPQIAFDTNGNGIAVYHEDSSVYARRYDKATDTWGALITLDSRTNSVSQPILAVDRATGDAVVAWVQSNGTAASVYANRYTASSDTWSGASLIDNLTTAVPTSDALAVAVNNAGQAIVVWRQPTTGSTNSLYAARYMSSAWQTPELLDSTNANAISDVPSVALDTAGNATVVWAQSDGTASSIYLNRYTASSNTWAGPTLPLETSGTAVNEPKVMFDSNGDGVAVWRESANLLARVYTKSSNTWASVVTLDNRSNTITQPTLAVDYTTGDTVVAWVQSDGTAASVYAVRYTKSNTTWSGSPTLIDNLNTAVPTTGSLAVAVNNNSQALITWRQPTTGSTNSLYAARYMSGSWQTAELLESNSNAVSDTPAIALDNSGNASVVWAQSDGTYGSTIYVNRYTAGTGWSGATTQVTSGKSYKEVTLTVAEALTGTRFTWTPSGTDIDEFNKLLAVTGVEVFWKNAAGTEVRVLSSYGNGGVTGSAGAIDAERLILRGGTSGLTGVTIKDSTGTTTIDTLTTANGKLHQYRTATGGLNFFWADVSGLASGTYMYVPIGTTSTLGALFEVKGQQTSAAIAVQELAYDVDSTVSTSVAWGGSSWSGSNAIDLDWSPLSQLGTGDVKVRVDYTATDSAGTLDIAGYEPQIAFDASGNGIAIYREDTSLYARRYDKTTDTWGDLVTLDSTNTNAVSMPVLAVDRASSGSGAGNAIVAWVQSNGTATSVYASRYTASTDTWSSAALIDNLTTVVPTSDALAVAINNAGQAIVVWRQPTTGSTNSLYAARYMSSAWQTPELLDGSNSNAISDVPSVALDTSGNASVVWAQSDGTASSIYLNRYTASSNTWAGATLPLETSATAANEPKIAFDSNGDGVAVWRESTNLLARVYTKSSNTWASVVTLDNRSNTITQPTLAVDYTTGDTAIAWIQSDGTAASVYAVRYTKSNTTWSASPTLIDNLNTAVPTSASLSVAVNNNSQAMITWRQPTTGSTNSVYAARFASGSWQTPVLLESNSNAVGDTARVALDNSGDASVIWAQSDGTYNSSAIYVNRYTASANVWTGGTTPVSIESKLQKDFTFSGANAFNGATLTWGATAPSSGSEYAHLSSVKRIQVWKTINGKEVLVFDNAGTQAGRQVLLSALPTTVEYLAVRYRPAGSSEEWLTLDTDAVTRLTDTTATNTGWFSLNYDSIPNGEWEFEFTATNSSHAAVNLTSLGGTSGGVYTTTVTLKRGAQSNIEMGAVGTSIAPEITQTLDRWGNILAINDPRDEAFVTTYRYDYANHQIAEVKPEVTAVDAHGTETTETPTVLYFYDGMGHVVKVIDAAGGIHKRTYDASGNVKTETEADGGVTHHYFDLFGREVATTNPLGNTTTNTYDLNNRLVQELRPLGLTHTYTYDQEGNRLTDTNAFGEAYRYKYDLFGHVIDSRLPLWTVSGGAAAYHTSYTYDLYGNKLTQENELGDDLAWSYGTSGNASAYFHRARTHTDMGATVTTMTYDTTGHIVSQTSASGAHGGQNLTYEYYADGKLKIINDLATHTETYYEYDALGNKTRERFASTSTSEVFQDTWMTYDAIGRVIDINDYQRYHLTYKYDISGNRRNINSIYTNASNVEKEKDYWYEYDAMNRITLAEGVLNTSTDLIEITSGSDAQGTRLYYDAAGQRAQSEHYSGSTYYTERYQYDENGKMLSVWRQSSDNGFVLQASHQYDAAGRETLYERYDSNGNLKNGRYSTYNANGWLTAVTDYAHTGAITKTDGEYTYDYAGNITNYDSTTSGTTTHYTYTYDKWDSYKEKRVVGTSPEFNSGKSVATYDVNGNLIQRTDENDDDNTKTYQSTLAGEILKKTIPSTSKVQYYYYADGKPVGSVGDLSDSTFDYNYTPVSGTYPSSAPGQYTVSDGDTLESVATAAWGDGSLWYLIADANGLDGTSTLVAGQVLTLPNTITNIHNNSNTFKPYSPSEIIGGALPTIGGYKCTSSDVGQVVVAIVIAIVIIYCSAGTATGEAVNVAGVLAGSAMGLNAAHQGAAMAAGKQNGFNWMSYGVTGVASYLGAVAGPAMGEAMGGALDAAFGTSMQIAGEQVASTAFTRMTSGAFSLMATSAVTQGVTIAAGQQDRFNWASLASTMVGAALASALMPSGVEGDMWASKHPILNTVAKNFINQTARIAVDGGGKFDWLEVAVDMFNNQIATSAQAAKRAEMEEDLKIDQRAYSRVDTNTQWGGMEEARMNAYDDYLVNRADARAFLGTQAAGAQYEIEYAQHQTQLAQYEQAQQQHWSAVQQAASDAGLVCTPDNPQGLPLEVRQGQGPYLTADRGTFVAAGSLEARARQVLNWGTGVAQTELAIASRIAGQIYGGLTMLAAAPFSDDSVALGHKVEAAAAYNPSSEIGQRYFANTGGALAPLAHGLELARTTLGDWGYDKTGSAFVGATLATLPDALLTFLAPEARGAFGSLGRGIAETSAVRAAVSATKTAGRATLDAVAPAVNKGMEALIDMQGLAPGIVPKALRTIAAPLADAFAQGGEALVDALSNFKATALNTKTNVLTDVVAQQIRFGTNGKVAIIGQSMDAVRAYRAALNEAGVVSEIFDGATISKGVRQKYRALSGKYSLMERYNGVIPATTKISSPMYTANKIWAKSLVEDGYTVIDVGNTFSIPKPTPFYKMELRTVPFDYQFLR